jgi:hypothetical protein
MADHAAGRQRQCRLQAPEAHGLDTAAGNQRQQEAGQCIEEGATVGVEQAIETAIAPGYGEQQEQHAPPGRNAKEIEQHIGQPGAETTAGIGDARCLGSMRPARISTIETPQDDAGVKGDSRQNQPARLVQQGDDFFRQRL